MCERVYVFVRVPIVTQDRFTEIVYGDSLDQRKMKIIFVLRSDLYSLN